MNFTMLYEKPTRPKVQILLAAHNGEKWISDQIDSILNQADVNVDIVVSDDASTDDTCMELLRFVPDSRVHIISPLRPRRSAAHNFLWLIDHVDITDHDFVAFADQDDIWFTDKLIRGCHALVTYGAAGYSSAVSAVWPYRKAKNLIQSNMITASDYLFEGAGQGCTFVLTAEFYKSIRKFFSVHRSLTHQLHYHDWAIYGLSRSWKMSWMFDPVPSMHYRQHATNDTGARVSLSGISRRLRLMRSGWYSRQLKIIAHICCAAAPTEPNLASWQTLLEQETSIVRKLKIIAFVLKGGRRRRVDRLIVLGAIVAGWI